MAHPLLAARYRLRPVRDPARAPLPHRPAFQRERRAGVRARGFSVDYECERVEAFLARQAAADRPFFLYYNISPPHCPMSDAPEKYTTMYRPEDMPIRPNVDLSRRLPDQDYWFKVYRWDYRYYNLHLPYTEDLPARLHAPARDRRVLRHDDLGGRRRGPDAGRAGCQRPGRRTRSWSSPPTTATTWAATAGCRRAICTRNRCGFR